MPTVIKMSGPNTLALAIPTSFVATVSEQSLGSFGPLKLADFWLSAGGWIVQVTATVRAPSDDIAVVQFQLTAATTPAVQNVAKTTVRGSYASIAMAIGLQVSTSTQVELNVTKTHDAGVDISDVRIVGIKEDKLTLVQL